MSFFGNSSPGNNGENTYRIGCKDDIDNVLDDVDNVDTKMDLVSIENVNQRAYQKYKKIFSNLGK